MPATLQAALLPFVILALSALAAKLGVDAKDFQGNIIFLATAIVALIVAGYGALMSWMQAKGKERADDRIPDISSKAGPKSAQVTIINDPSSPEPPTVIIKPHDPTP